MFVLWKWNKDEKCPAFGKTCTNCLKNNHFQAVWKFKKINVERVEENEINMEVFSVKNKNEEKIEQKKKGIILKIKINFYLDMQMDTGSKVMLIPKKFWERIG